MLNYKELEIESSNNFSEMMKLFASKGKMLAKNLKNEELEPADWVRFYSRWQRLLLIMKEFIMYIEALEVEDEAKELIEKIANYVRSVDKSSRNLQSENRFKCFEDIEKSFCIVADLFSHKD